MPPGLSSDQDRPVLLLSTSGTDPTPDGTHESEVREGSTGGPCPPSVPARVVSGKKCLGVTPSSVSRVTHWNRSRERERLSTRRGTPPAYQGSTGSTPRTPTVHTRSWSVSFGTRHRFGCRTRSTSGDIPLRAPSPSVLTVRNLLWGRLPAVKSNTDPDGSGGGRRTLPSPLPLPPPRFQGSWV